MSPRGAAVAEVFRSALATIDTLDPAEQDHIIAALVSDLQTRRPVAVRSLSVLPPPTERIADPRAQVR